MRAPPILLSLFAQGLAQCLVEKCAEYLLNDSETFMGEILVTYTRNIFGYKRCQDLFPWEVLLINTNGSKYRSAIFSVGYFIPLLKQSFVIHLFMVLYYLLQMCHWLLFLHQQFLSLIVLSPSNSASHLVPWLLAFFFAADRAQHKWVEGTCLNSNLLFLPSPCQTRISKLQGVCFHPPTSSLLCC